MKNLNIILFIFFVLFLILTIFSFDPLPLFLVIFLAFLICLICLISYLGTDRGIFAALALICLPFLLEYLFYKFNLPFFETPLIRYLTTWGLDLPITLTNLFTVFSVPLLFISALFFAQKIKLLANIKNYHKTFLFLVTAILISLNWLMFSQNQLVYNNFLKWLLVALITNALIVRFYKFKAQTAEIYKEMPIIIYLAIYGTSALKRLDSLNLTITALLTLFYLILLYNEFKIKKLKINWPF